MRGILFAPSGQAAVTFSFWQRFTASWSSGLAPAIEPSLSPLLVPFLMDNLVFVDVKQNDFLPSERADHWTVAECERMVL